MSTSNHVARRRPPEFINDPSLLQLREKLAEVCTEALTVAKLAKRGVSTYEATYDFSSDKYVELARRRDILIERILKYWNRPDV